MAGIAAVIFIVIVTAIIALLFFKPPMIAPIRGKRKRAVAAIIVGSELLFGVPLYLIIPASSGMRELALLLPLLLVGMILGAIVIAHEFLFVQSRLRREASELRVSWAQAETSFGRDYPYLLRTRGRTQDSFLCMTGDGSRVRMMELTPRQGQLERTADVEVAIGDIVSIELVKHEELITRSVTETRRTGAVGRAVVGELLFGSTGALVGAVSARSRSTTTGVQQRLYQYSELVFGLRDLQNPVVRFIHRDHAEAERWLHRIRGAMARAGVPSIPGEFQPRHA